MSKFKGNRRIDYDGKDQYYTKPLIAEHCVNQVKNILIYLNMKIS